MIAHAGRAVLVLGALGVVYGDIGTSPLYTEQVIFSSYRATAHITPAAVYGVASLIFWALMVVVSIKYAGFIMRAHNRGDGGIMALAALLQRNRVAHGALFVTLGIFGAALFFGDGVITPAISVLGSIQGVQVATPALAHLIVPLSVAILLGLFVLQRFGSGTIGWLFGPVILVWFTVIGVLGLSEVLKDPAVLQGLSPSWAVRFMIDHGAAGYLVLGGVVLAVTGAEALYADRGHFGASPIRLGWFGLALPALMLNYLGQAVFILHHPTLAKDASTFNPFYQMAPSWALWPLVILAAVATVIASQAAISGSFSVAKQAVQLGFLPRLKVLHTSKIEGQIYVPVINWALCIGVIALTLVFGSATKLGDIYGVAVTGTFILNTMLFLAVARLLWGTSKRKLAPVAVLFLTVEVAFFSSNIAKVEHGAWLPLAVGCPVSIVMINWRRGQVIVTTQPRRPRRTARRVPRRARRARTAAHPHPDRRGVPLPGQGHHPAGAARRGRAHPHAARKGRDRLRRHGQHPARRHLRQMRGRGARPRPVQGRPPDRPDSATTTSSTSPRRSRWRASKACSSATSTSSTPPTSSRASRSPPPTPRACDAGARTCSSRMARNASSAIDHFGLPGDRTVIMGSQVAL